MSETKMLITAERFFEMSFPDVRTELVDGEILQISPPGYRHGRICVRLSRRLDEFVERSNLGAVVSEVGFILRRDPDMVRGPDVAFLSAPRLAELPDPSKFWPGPPDLAVEVLSPEDRASEVSAKVGDYLDAGAVLVWVVDPESRTVSAYRGIQSVRVYRGDDELSAEDLLPGFRLKLADLFS
jgi:Uma2 family endonuclease